MLDWKMKQLEARLRDKIIDVPDFPKPGIIFKDITPVLLDFMLLQESTLALVQHPNLRSYYEAVIAPESRGFIFGALVAQRGMVGLIPARKPGKLPRATISTAYALEYGSDVLCIHADAIQKGDKILLVDDVLATGGTLAACAELVRLCGGTVVGASVLIELAALGGRDRLQGIPVHSIIKY